MAAETLAHARPIALAFFLLARPGFAGDPYDQIAHQAAAALRQAGLKQLRVAPLASADGHARALGPMIRTNIVERLARVQDVEVVEAGPEDGSTTVAPTAVLTGTYINLGPTIRLALELSDRRRGAICWATERQLRNDWITVDPDASPAPPAPAPARSEPLCAHAAVQASSSDAGTVDLRARSWALSGGGGETTEEREPWRRIRDEAVRREFLERARFWLGQERIPALTADETRALERADAREFARGLECPPATAEAR